MRARMEEISVFYNENLDDEKIHFFEKLRLRLKKALFNRPGKKFMQQNLESAHYQGTNEDLYNTQSPEQDFFPMPALSNTEVNAW